MTSMIARALAVMTFSMAAGHCAGLATTPIGKTIEHAVVAAASTSSIVVALVAD
jgi:hypothetical protein